MHNGHRRELLTMIPLSTEKASTGNPAICQALIFTGSPSVVVNENVSEQGTFFALQASVQFLKHCLKH